MLWIKAFHIIFVVTWFSSLFYLPRLFVYHAMAEDSIGIKRFELMERKLYYGIATPSGILASFFGFWLLLDHWTFYAQHTWMQVKLAFVVLLWIYHWLCGKYRRDFKDGNNNHSHIFYRWFNEIPVVILLVTVIMVVVKPGA